MEKEISTGTLLVIVLVALAAVIGMGFAVFKIAKGTANEGNQGLSAQTSYASSSWSSIYNDGEVTGKQLETLVTKDADSKNISVFVCTRGFNNKAPLSRETPVLMYNQNCYVNYGIIFDYSDNYYGYRNGEVVYEGESELFTVRDGSSLKTKYLPKLEDGKLKKNLNFQDVTANGTGGYIDLHAKFRCNLIYGADGEVCGVIARQVNKPTAVTTNKEALSTGVTGMGAIVNSYSNNSSNIPLTSPTGGKPVEVVQKDGVTLITSTTKPGGGIGTVGTGSDTRTEEIKENASVELSEEDLEIFIPNSSDSTMLQKINITQAYVDKYGTDLVIQVPDKFSKLYTSFSITGKKEAVKKVIFSPTMTTIKASNFYELWDYDNDICFEIPGTVISFNLAFYSEMCDFIIPYHCEGGVLYDPWSVDIDTAEAWKDEHITCFDCGCTACGAATGKGDPYVWLWSDTTIIGYTGTLSGDIEIPNGCTSVGARAMCNVTLDSLTFPNTCTSIGNECMMGAKIGKLNLGNGMEQLNNYAFQDCIIGGDTLCIPSSMTYISDYAFANALVPETLVIEKLVSGIHLGDTIWGVKHLVISSSAISNMPSWGFTPYYDSCNFNCTPENSSGLESISLPSSILGVNALPLNGSVMGTLKFPKNQTYLPSGEWYLSAFSNIDWPSKLVTLQAYSLQNLAMSEIKIPNTVTTLSNYWANGIHSSVNKLIIPPSVTSASNKAYHSRSGLILVAPAHLYNNHTNRIAYASTTSNRPVMQWYDCGCSNCDSYLGYVTVANPY